MEEPEKYVNWTANALLMVSDIYDYLENVSGEDFASHYVDDLLEFGNNLNTKSEHFPYCRNAKLQAKGYRCTTFRKSYVLIYKGNATQVNILAVIHSRRSPEIFEAVDDDA
jgi:plasmid stabilization system protein ParE